MTSLELCTATAAPATTRPPPSANSAHALHTPTTQNPATPCACYRYRPPRMYRAMHCSFCVQTRAAPVQAMKLLSPQHERQPTSQPVSPPASQSGCVLAGSRSASHPVSPAASQPASPPASPPASQPVSPPASSQAVCWLAASQPAMQSAHQPASQPCRLCAGWRPVSPASQRSRQPTSQPAHLPVSQPPSQPVWLCAGWRPALLQPPHQLSL